MTRHHCKDRELCGICRQRIEAIEYERDGPDDDDRADEAAARYFGI